MLLGIIRDPNALDTSKVQAARVLATLEAERSEGTTDEVALWLARRDAMLTLPPHERLTWLLGEMEELPKDDPAPPEKRKTHSTWPTSSSGGRHPTGRWWDSSALTPVLQ